jgi:hypothetical protein
MQSFRNARLPRIASVLLLLYVARDSLFTGAEDVETDEKSRVRILAATLASRGAWRVSGGGVTLAALSSWPASKMQLRGDKEEERGGGGVTLLGGKTLETAPKLRSDGEVVRSLSLLLVQKYLLFQYNSTNSDANNDESQTSDNASCRVRTPKEAAGLAEEDLPRNVEASDAGRRTPKRDPPPPPSPSPSEASDAGRHTPKLRSGDDDAQTSANDPHAIRQVQLEELEKAWPGLESAPTQRESERERERAREGGREGGRGKGARGGWREEALVADDCHWLVSDSRQASSASSLSR